MFSFMSEQESSNYLEIYAYHSSQAAFNQDVARDLLMKTGLQSDKLAVIWYALNHNFVGKFD